MCIRDSVLILWALYASVNAYSQDCTQASASQKPGIWKEGMKGSVSGIQPADLDRERKVVATIHLLVKSKYTPIGVEADYNGSYDRPDDCLLYTSPSPRDRTR